jgi:protoheme IX farnesyltransferase
MTESAFSRNTQTLDRPIDCSGVKPYVQLVKLPLSATVAASALAGFFMRPDRLEGAPVTLTICVLLLACGCAALNNYQDRRLDGRFARTRRRPLPSGCISPERARTAALALIICGMAGLFWQPLPVPLLGGIAVICYNGLYTPLKRLTAWAMLPGAICGMLPPWMGWLAAGGDPVSIQIILVMIIFGIWQMPHFWLILLTHAADYQDANLPSPLMSLTPIQLERIVLVWVVALGALMLCLPLVRLIQTLQGLALLLVNTAVLVGFFLWHYRRGNHRPVYRGHFTRLNLAVFISMTIVICERALYWA